MHAQRKALNHMDPQGSRESLGDLLGDLMMQSTELVKGEVALAKAELRVKIRAYRSAACITAAGAALGLLASMALLAAGIIALGAYVGLAASSVILSALLGVPATLLVLQGVGHFKRIFS